MIDDANAVYQSLSWKPDMKVINDFGEKVWLKKLYVDGNYNTVEPTHPEAKRHGITDCCFVDKPCLKHSKMQTILNIAELN
jgi:hypothetical protein